MASTLNITIQTDQPESGDEENMDDAKQDTDQDDEGEPGGSGGSEGHARPESEERSVRKKRRLDQSAEKKENKRKVCVHGKRGQNQIPCDFCEPDWTQTVQFGRVSMDAAQG